MRVGAAYNFVIMILSFLFWAIVIYLAFKVLTRLVIPVWRTTRQVRRAFRDMHSQMQQAQAQQQQPAQAQPVNSGRPSSGDYIEFEEIKD